MNEENNLDRVNDRLERGFAEVRQDIRELAAKFDGRLEKQDDRIRALEVKNGQMVFMGALGSVLIGPGLALLGTLLIWHLGH